VVPAATHSQTYALGMDVGLEGKKASLSNALSRSERFHLTHEQAKTEIEKLQDIVSKWKSHFQKCGLNKTEIQKLENSFAGKP